MSMDVHRGCEYDSMKNFFQEQHESYRPSMRKYKFDVLLNIMIIQSTYIPVAFLPD